jgi:hypothetical protein
MERSPNATFWRMPFTGGSRISPTSPLPFLLPHAACRRRQESLAELRRRPHSQFAGEFTSRWAMGLCPSDRRSARKRSAGPDIPEPRFAHRGSLNREFQFVLGKVSDARRSRPETL